MINLQNIDTGPLRCSRAGNRVQIVRKKGKVGDTTEKTCPNVIGSICCSHRTYQWT